MIAPPPQRPMISDRQPAIPLSGRTMTGIPGHMVPEVKRRFMDESLLSRLQEAREFEADPDAPPGNFPHTDPDDPYWSPEQMSKRHEFHPPEYAYLGPGTEYVAKAIFGSGFYEEKMRAAGRVPKGGQGPGKYDIPYNELDACAMEHDRVYTDLNSSRQDRITSDQKLLECFETHRFKDVEQYVMGSIAAKLIQSKMGLQDIGVLDPDAFASRNISNETVEAIANVSGADPTEEGIRAFAWATSLGFFNLLDSAYEATKRFIRPGAALAMNVFLMNAPYWLRRYKYRNPQARHQVTLINLLLDSESRLRQMTPSVLETVKPAITYIIAYFGLPPESITDTALVALAEYIIQLLPDYMNLDWVSYWKRMETQAGDVEDIERARSTMPRSDLTQLFRDIIGVAINGAPMRAIRASLNAMNTATNPREQAAATLATIRNLLRPSTSGDSLLRLIQMAIRESPLANALEEPLTGPGVQYMTLPRMRELLTQRFDVPQQGFSNELWDTYIRTSQNTNVMDILLGVFVPELATAAGEETFGFTIPFTRVFP